MRFINDNKQSLKQISFCTYISERLGAVGLALLLIIFSCVKTSDEKCLINNKYFDFFFSLVASRSLANCRQRQNYVFSLSSKPRVFLSFFLAQSKVICVFITRGRAKKMFLALALPRTEAERERKSFSCASSSRDWGNFRFYPKSTWRDQYTKPH